MDSESDSAILSMLCGAVNIALNCTFLDVYHFDPQHLLRNKMHVQLQMCKQFIG